MGSNWSTGGSIIRKHFSTVRVMEHWWTTPVVGSPCLEIFKTHLDVVLGKVLGNLLLVVRLEPGGLDQIP